MNFRLKIKGSMNDIKRVELERQTTAMETVLSLMDRKKVNQCIATTPPVSSKPPICFHEISFFFLMKNPMRKSEMKEMAMRKKAVLSAVIDISPPMIPVKPQTNTVMCKMR